ncbi:PAS domain-containing protein [Novosphingobium sp. Gsoil 351]|uniref:PAS domain-containing protein n=1 Tax=Novosphingobium sp. Gsoil 351 TaxID=2675225 RepID=UPI001E282EA9|nr:PAS domain-containing protein [Novosphingobium sp. Gsoil 351]
MTGIRHPSESLKGIADKAPFSSPEAIFGDFDAGVGMRLAMAAGDIALVLDTTGRIVDISANPVEFPDMNTWAGSLWSETVTIESRIKVAEMLECARKGETQRWRQVNHISRGGDVAVRYTVVPLAGGRRTIALGRDMRDSAALQQRLLQAQQSLERDYMRLRQVETRYRLLFDMSAEPVLIVDADTQRIREANPAAHELLAARPGTLAGQRLTALFARTAREPLLAFLGSVMTSNSVSPIEVEYGHGERTLTLSATGFRQHGGRFPARAAGSNGTRVARSDPAARGDRADARRLRGRRCEHEDCHRQQRLRRTRRGRDFRPTARSGAGRLRWPAGYRPRAD